MHDPSTTHRIAITHFCVAQQQGVNIVTLYAYSVIIQRKC